MPDHLSPRARSEHMRRIRKTDTKPEMRVRRAAHRLGYRFRLHRSDLPGTPDMVFPRLSKVVLVHGCFWHQHAGCRLARLPKSRLDYWLPKLERNQQRDGMDGARDLGVPGSRRGGGGSPARALSRRGGLARRKKSRRSGTLLPNARSPSSRKPPFSRMIRVVSNQIPVARGNGRDGLAAGRGGSRRRQQLEPVATAGGS